MAKKQQKFVRNWRSVLENSEKYATKRDTFVRKRRKCVKNHRMVLEIGKSVLNV